MASAGKGDKPRPVNKRKFASNYDDIFKPKFKFHAWVRKTDIIEEKLKLIDPECDFKYDDEDNFFTVRSYEIKLEDFIEVGCEKYEDKIVMGISDVQKIK